MWSALIRIRGMLVFVACRSRRRPLQDAEDAETGQVRKIQCFMAK